MFKVIPKRKYYKLSKEVRKLLQVLRAEIYILLF